MLIKGKLLSSPPSPRALLSPPSPCSSPGRQPFSSGNLSQPPWPHQTPRRCLSTLHSLEEQEPPSLLQCGGTWGLAAGGARLETSEYSGPHTCCKEPWESRASVHLPSFCVLMCRMGGTLVGPSQSLLSPAAHLVESFVKSRGCAEVGTVTYQ